MTTEEKNTITKAILYRLLPTVLVFVFALLAFKNGVYFEGKPNISSDTIFVQIYYTIGLFLLAGIDLGMPMGGTEFHRFLLFISYFLAPLITVLAVIEAVLKSISPDYLKRAFKNHVVIIGASKEAISIIHGWNDPVNQLDEAVEHLQYHEGTKLLIVEKDSNNTKLEYFRELSSKRKVKIIIGDINHSEILSKLNVKEALGCIITTNSDILNINIALKLQKEYKIKAENIITRVEDFDLQYLINDDDDITFTSSHRKLANCFFHKYIETFLYLENLVIFGFGTFGQNILESISRSIKFNNLIIVDPDAEQKYQNWLYKKKIFNSDYKTLFKVKTYNNKQEDSKVLEIIKEKYNNEQCIHFIMCAKLPDFANIKLAINIANSFNNSLIYLRSESTLYEKRIGFSSDGVWDSWAVFSEIFHGKSSSKNFVAKFAYGGYYTSFLSSKSTLASAIKDETHPDRVVVGADGVRVNDELEPKYKNIHLFNEISELKNYGRTFNDLLNPQFFCHLSAKEIELEDPVQNSGAQMVKEAASKTNDANLYQEKDGFYKVSNYLSNDRTFKIE